MGTALSAIINQGFPPKSKFSVDDIPDLTGRVVLVTGGYGGIGYEIIKALLQHNAKVYMASRNKQKAEAAIASLKTATGKEAIFLEVDLSSLASVKKSAEEFLSKENELHILFNNAGVMIPPLREATQDGYDLQFGTNVVAHFYLTELLMPALLAAVASSPDRHARIVTTTSSAAYLGKLRYDTFRDGPARLKSSRDALYTQSKLGNTIVAHETAKRYAEKGIVSFSVNPGNIQTELQRHVPGLVRKFLNVTMLHPTPFGALTPLFAGTSEEALNYNGEYLIPWARLGKCLPETYDAEVGAKLWEWLEGEVKAFEATQIAA